VERVRDLESLSRKIDETLGGFPPETPADARAAEIASLIDAHCKGIVKAIGSAREYGAFLHEVGFAKAAVKKLAPAFKSISGDEVVSETILARINTLTAALRADKD
jgi:hypothetical protein